MEKLIFTWEYFKKGWDLNHIVIHDTKENMEKFCMLAEENGIILENESMKCELKEYVEVLYYMDNVLYYTREIDEEDISYTLEEVLEDLNIIDIPAKPLNEEVFELTEQTVRQIVREEIEKILSNVKLTIDK